MSREHEIRNANTILEQAYRREDLAPEICQTLARVQSATRIWMVHKSATCGLQPNLQPNDVQSRQPYRFGTHGGLGTSVCNHQRILCALCKPLPHRHAGFRSL